MKSIPIRLCGLCAIAFTWSASHGAEPAIRPLLLFMQPTDALDPIGMLRYEANPLAFYGPVLPIAADATASSPAVTGGHRENSTLPFLPMLAVPQPDGGYLVYGSDSKETSEQPRTFTWRLYRVRTLDGHHYSDLRQVAQNPKGPWLIEASMVQLGAGGRLLFYPWSRSDQPAAGHALWGFFSDDGQTWRSLSEKPIYLDHDAFGMMWDARSNRILTGQVTNQPYRKPYPDNMGGDKRRVLSMRTSRDGLNWETAGNNESKGLITPDDKDSPETELYRMQPFACGDRYVAMVDLYAASPLTPNKHGPHLACEWWVSSDGMHWQRPWRSLDAQGDAPYPIKMTPMYFGRRMLFWVAGQVCGLPEYRLASVGARANAEFSSALFAMPDKPLLLNASIPEGHGLFDQAYLQVELRDEKNNVIPGYERDKCLLTAVDDTRIPLRWGDRTGRELAGRKVSMRFYLRSARIYAITTEEGGTEK